MEAILVKLLEQGAPGAILALALILFRLWERRQDAPGGPTTLFSIDDRARIQQLAANIEALMRVMADQSTKLGDLATELTIWNERFGTALTRLIEHDKVKFDLLSKIRDDLKG